MAVFMKKLKFFIIVLMCSKGFASDSGIEDYHGEDITNYSKSSSPIKSLKSPSRKSTIASLHSDLDDKSAESEQASPLAPTKKRSKLSEEFFQIDKIFIDFNILSKSQTIFSTPEYQEKQKIISMLLDRSFTNLDLEEIFQDLDIYGAYITNEAGNKNIDLNDILEKATYLTPKDFVENLLGSGYSKIIISGSMENQNILENFVTGVQEKAQKNKLKGASYFNLYTQNKEIYDSRLEQFKKLLSNK
jgi:hypothetical protein